VVPRGAGVLLFATCCLQILIGCMLDRSYDTKLLRYFVDTIWYPIAFWAISMIAAVIALPGVIRQRRGKRARWVSPDRGIRACDPAATQASDSPASAPPDLANQLR